MANIFLATTNFSKVEEIKAFFADYPEINFASWLDLPDEEPLEVEETASDYARNAFLKAAHTAAYLDMFEMPLPFSAASMSSDSPFFVLADDSGLEITALDDFPGVQTARWAGDVPQEVKNNLLLEKMQGISDRRARFVAVLALVSFTSPAPEIFRGVCSGTLATFVSGNAGFGYDPLFIPDSTPTHSHNTLTFADLSLEVKNTISHRALALKQLKDYLSKNH